MRADKPAVEIRILGLGAGSGRVRADKPAVGGRLLGLGAGNGPVRADKPAVGGRLLGLGAGNGPVRADKPAVGFRRLGLGAGSGQVRGDGGRGSAHFDAGGGDGAHGAVDTAGEEGYEREAAEIEARGGGETC